MRINIITLNCFFNPISNNSFRIKFIIDKICRFKPDIICLQEVASFKQVYICKQVLKTFGYNIFNIHGTIFNKGGLVFASRFPIKNWKFVKFKNQGKFFSLQITDRILSKGFQRIELLINSKVISVYNTHIISTYNKLSRKEKIEQGKQLIELSNIIKNDSIPYKICIGDLNIQSFGNYYFKFIEKTNLIDSLNQNLITFSSKNTHSGWFNIDIDSRIDYVLYSSNIKNIETKIIFKDPLKIQNKVQHLSDHFGIYSSLEI